LDIIGSLGYESAAITIDHHALNPWDEDFSGQLYKVNDRNFLSIKKGIKRR